MTHEELLGKINKPQALSIQYTGLASEIEILTLIAFRNALRVVVELHKPNQDHPEYCDVCWWEEHERETYPCQTIQAIEKKLQ